VQVTQQIFVVEEWAKNFQEKLNTEVYPALPRRRLRVLLDWKKSA